MKRKILMILSLIVVTAILASLLIVSAYSNKRLNVPGEWHQTTGRTIIAEQWSWDWTNYETSGPWNTGPSYTLYEMVGDILFLTYPGGTIMTAYRIGETNTWMWSGGSIGMGGPGGSMMLMSNMTITIKFTREDLPETNDDNNYAGLRMLGDMRQDLYQLINTGGNSYVWQGLVHQHFLSWAPEGAKI